MSMQPLSRCRSFLSLRSYLASPSPGRRELSGVRPGLAALVALLAILTGASAHAQQREQTTLRPVSGETSVRSAVPARLPEKHPLAPALDFATARHDWIRKHIRDYTCRVTKRERIEGKLQDFQYIDAKVRREQENDGRVISPMSVFLKFLAPTAVEDRRVLYIEGANDGKMLVRRGGPRFGYLTVTIEPDGEAARRESMRPINQLGFDEATRSLIQRMEDDMAIDPTGENTRVEFFTHAKVGDRSTTHVRVVHPRQQKELEFYQADVYIDDALHVPVRLEVQVWPAKEGEEPQLLAEYNYTNIRFNVGLRDADFAPDLLK